jgi:Phage capsid protein
MPIQTEIWVRDIAEKLMPDNSFVRRSRNDDAFVNNLTVHRPQAGLLPTVERNRTVLPAAAVQRTDSVNDYNIVEFTSTPTLVRNIEEVEVSYAKRTSVLSGHTKTIDRDIANFMATLWAPSGNSGLLVPTTGANRAASAPGATGTRKATTVADIRNLRRLLDKQDIPQDDRFLLLSSDMYADLLADTQMTNRDFMPMYDQATGIIGKLLGFDLYIRSNVGRYATGSNVVKDALAANAATDNAFGLAWHADCVAAAKGETKVFDNVDDPTYYGSIFSTLARAGGQKYYSSQEGVLALVESV